MAITDYFSKGAGRVPILKTGPAVSAAHFSNGRCVDQKIGGGWQEHRSISSHPVEEEPRSVDIFPKALLSKYSLGGQAKVQVMRPLP
jgi:hypothetical protein